MTFLMSIISRNITLLSMYFLIGTLLLIFGKKIIKRRFKSYPHEFVRKKVLLLRLFTGFLLLNGLIIAMVVFDIV